MSLVFIIVWCFFSNLDEFGTTEIWKFSKITIKKKTNRPGAAVCAWSRGGRRGRVKPSAVAQCRTQSPASMELKPKNMIRREKDDDTLPKLNRKRPWKSYNRTLTGKDRLPFPTFFRGKVLNFGGVYDDTYFFWLIFVTYIYIPASFKCCKYVPCSLQYCKYLS